MSKRNARNKTKLAVLDEINQIDRRLKRVKNKEEETSKLMSQRNKLREKLKTKKLVNWSQFKNLKKQKLWEIWVTADLKTLQEI